jgi:hypothetical protein
MVEEADIVIAEASFPSIGLGIELQIAQQSATPIILCFTDYPNNKVHPVTYRNPDSTTHELQIGEGYVSLMALGVPEIIKVIHYRSHSHGQEQVLAAVELVEKG